MNYKRFLSVNAFTLTLLLSGSALATSFEEYVQRLGAHPQVMSILAESDASMAQARGARGLPDPVIMIGVDNVPISDPSFDRFLPTSKVIGFSQDIPNPAVREAASARLEQISEKQSLIAAYTKQRLRFMLVVKLAEFESVQTQTKLIRRQLGFYEELEETFKGQIESGRALYQRFSEVDVERAEVERKLNDLDARLISIKAGFIRLIDAVPDIDVPDITNTPWEHDSNVLYPVLIAAQDIDIAKKGVGIADAAFLPNFGISGVYKQREDGANGAFEGDDWFSIQAKVTFPLWASNNQKPKLKAAKDLERSAVFAYEDLRGQWVAQMIGLQSRRDAAAKNVKVLQDKDYAMKSKIAAAQRNYEAGTEDLDRILLAKIDRLNIQVKFAELKAMYLSMAAEFNSNIMADLTEEASQEEIQE
ncbi:MAG: hypothetical protein COB36_07995 [Alphaproteobacteria bacterium]|nr:MAG: hypothetical protein COB36_07995 [Alphaproteobacteria bacterium]